MPVVEASIVVTVPPDVAFAVSQTTAPVRYRWDPFVREQHFVDRAVTRPGKGVQTFTRQRFGFSMVSEYVSFHPPTNVGMKMVRGPWFFEMFAGGWRFVPAETPGHSVATWRYSFRCRPAVLRPLAELIGRRVLTWEMRRRIAGYARGCADPVVLEAAHQAIADRTT